MLTSSPAWCPPGPQVPAGTDPQFAAAETSARASMPRAIAMGEEPASIVLRGGRVVDVFSAVSCAPTSPSRATGSPRSVTSRRASARTRW